MPIPLRYAIQALVVCSLGAAGLPAQTVAPVSLIHGAAALADFDGDSRVDFAVASYRPGSAHGSLYRIDVHLAGGPAMGFDVEIRNRGGLHVAAFDIDGDHDIDLVITTEYAHEPVAVWLNDGRGVFSPADPSWFPAAWRDSQQGFARAERPKEGFAALASAPGAWDAQLVCHATVVSATCVLPRRPRVAACVATARESVFRRGPPAA